MSVYGLEGSTGFDLLGGSIMLIGMARGIPGGVIGKYRVSIFDL